MRYRHFDNDFFRASRQQDFLRQVSHQDAIRQLLDASKIKELAHIFGRYFEVDDSFVKTSNLIGMAQLGLYMAQSKAPVNEVRFPAYEAKNPQLDSYLYVKDSDLRKTVDEFMTGKGSSNPRKLDETTKPDATPTVAPARRRRTSRPRCPASSRRASRARTWPSWPRPRASSGSRSTSRALRKTGSRYADTKPRIYGIRDVDRQAAPRLPPRAQRGRVPRVLRRPGHVLEGPADPRRPGPHAHRRRPQAAALLRRLSHLRLVAWKTQKAAYWVTNTLNLSIPNSGLIAIGGLAAPPEDLIRGQAPM